MRLRVTKLGLLFFKTMASNSALTVFQSYMLLVDPFSTDVNNYYKNFFCYQRKKKVAPRTTQSILGQNFFIRKRNHYVSCHFSKVGNTVNICIFQILLLITFACIIINTSCYRSYRVIPNATLQINTHQNDTLQIPTHKLEYKVVQNLLLDRIFQIWNTVLLKHQLLF